jgi:hypothetical protein
MSAPHRFRAISIRLSDIALLTPFVAAANQQPSAQPTCMLKIRLWRYQFLRPLDAHPPSNGLPNSREPRRLTRNARELDAVIRQHFHELQRQFDYFALYACAHAARREDRVPR